MRINVTQPLFAWAALEDSPSLGVVRRCLEAVADAALLEGLRRARGRGRDDFPVSLLWGVALLTPLLRHASYDACLGEVRRNPALKRLLGIETDDQIPKHWNLSRFLDVLGHPAHLAAIRACFDVMVRRLAVVVPDLGRRIAGDATALSARRGDAKRQEAETKLGLPQPAGGRKEYKDDDGKVTKVVAWFGYKLHLLVDVRHELVLAYHITAPAVGDNEVIATLLEQARGNLPAGRIESLAYDKAADDEAVHRLLNTAGVKPLIENRSMWKSELERMLPGHTGRSNLVYDESGTVYCYDKVSDSPVRHRMSYVGHEAKRGTLKYRCPARHEGWTCPSDARCNAGLGYGVVARIKSELDLRRFPPIPRATKQFERLYNGRTAVERVNARLKLYWGADDGNVIGARRFHAMAGVVLLVHLALATTLARTGRSEMKTLGGTRLSPIAKPLEEQIAHERSASGGE
jgi:Transposase DDE domain/Transposase domain (DUF772)